jgi:hypothetical protein
MSVSGRIRCSAGGNHRAARLSSASSAGTSVIRTSNASVGTPNPRPQPIVLSVASCAFRKPANEAENAHDVPAVGDVRNDQDDSNQRAQGDPFL